MSKTRLRTGGPAKRGKRFRLSSAMQNFIFLLCGAALLWFVFLALWADDDKQTDQTAQNHGMRPSEVKFNGTVLHGNAEGKPHALGQSVDWWLVPSEQAVSKIFLVSTSKASSRFLKQIRLLLGSARLETTVVAGDAHAVVLQLIDLMGNISRGQRMLFVFTNAAVYYKILCRSPTFFLNRFGESVKILVLLNADEDRNSVPDTGCWPFSVEYVSNATHVTFSQQSRVIGNVFRILRTSGNGVLPTLSLYDESQMRLASLTRFNQTSWHPVLCTADSPDQNENNENNCDNALLLISRDVAENMQANVAILAANLEYWWSQVTLLELIGYLQPDSQLSLERYLLVDIDDAFIGKEGTKMAPDDVTALVNEQTNIARMVKQFRFNIGFSAHSRFFHHGSALEIAGDDMLLENRDKFWWFPHMYDHMQPHLFSDVADLESRMRKNLQFANVQRIALVPGYAVSPHHSGVYPVHQPLYDAWQRVYNITVTSTEQYPHLKPFGLHRGFRYHNVSVLPRQVCGLYTKTLHFSDFPGGGGLSALNKSIFGGGGGDGPVSPSSGGEIFTTLLTKPISIFMTHMLNYASGDRVALYTFREALKFITERTTLQFQTVPPTELAALYFEKFYPQDNDPVWSNPCDDMRHREIWVHTAGIRNNKSSPANDVCDSLPLPDAVIVGPQKTGTTALYTFLKQHPALQSSVLNKAAPFEEVQFFSSHHLYADFGLEWYLKQFAQGIEKFPTGTNTRNHIVYPNARMLFEKSATYFDSELTPMRMHALLPHAQVIVILADPVKRAYSWYLHAKAHGDAAAIRYSFYDVIKPAIQQQFKSNFTFDAEAADDTRNLRNRCVEPGKYAVHIRRWLKYYAASQFLFIDADELLTDPVQVMIKIQTFLKLEPQIDYSNLLRYSPKKHFYCPVVVQPNGNSSRVRCLGSSKGRSVISEPIDRKVEFGLRGYNRQHNLELFHLLRQLGKDAEMPRWLKDNVGDAQADVESSAVGRRRG